MSVAAAEIVYTDDRVEYLATDREPWIWRNTVCVGEPGNTDPSRAVRVPTVNVRTFRLIDEAEAEGLDVL